MNVENKYKDKIFTIPNILSIFRIVLIPFFIWLYTIEQNYVWALIILIVSGVTDLLDGFIARRFKMTSDFGKMLDPVADKLTQVSVLFCLIFRFKLMLMPFLLLILKELILGIMSFLVITKTGEVEGAEWHGKVTTTLLYGMMGFHVIWYDAPKIASNMIILFTVSFMLLSLVLYFIQHLKTILKQMRKKDIE